MRPPRARLLLAAGLLAGVVAGGAAARPKPTLLLKPCDVQSIPAGCGTLSVPEDRSRPHGRRIGLHVVLIPARHQPAESDAFVYLAGGPGVAATSESYELATTWAPVRDRHDIILVDQRGTGGSHPLVCPRGPASTAPGRLRAWYRSCAARLRADPTQYGTRAAADDLDAVRRALGYEQLDVYGVSYGATVAQVYLRRHGNAVRTLVLDGATALGVPFYANFARNAQRALAQLERRCAAAPACARRFPHWGETLRRLVRDWNRRPVHRTRAATTSGDELAGVVQAMLLDAETAAQVPLVVTRAAAGDYGPLNEQVRPGDFTRQLEFWSVWCSEPWVGLGTRGPWHTLFDGYTASTLAAYRRTCAALPHRVERAAAWGRPQTKVPTLVLAGGADPQDPLRNLPGFRRAFPNGHAIVLPGYAHGVAQYGCVAGLASIFIDSAGAAALDERCVGSIQPPPFALSP